LLTPGWGKAQSRAETSALGTPSLWKASPHYHLLKKQQALHAKPHPIGPRSHCSAGQGISEPLACSSAQPGLRSTGPPNLPQTPTPQARTPQVCQASNPQARKISAGPCLSVLPGWWSTGTAQSLLDHPLGPAKPVIHRHTWSPPGPWSTAPHPSGLPSPLPTGPHDLYSTRPVPLRHTRPMLQRPARSQWQASAHRPGEPTQLPPATRGFQTCLGDTDRSRC
jgi:hypothetical protein